jgi:hypothetical protein
MAQGVFQAALRQWCEFAGLPAPQAPQARLALSLDGFALELSYSAFDAPHLLQVRIPLGRLEAGQGEWVLGRLLHLNLQSVARHQGVLACDGDSGCIYLLQVLWLGEPEGARRLMPELRRALAHARYVQTLLRDAALAPEDSDSRERAHALLARTA